MKKNSEVIRSIMSDKLTIEERIEASKRRDQELIDKPSDPVNVKKVKIRRRIEEINDDKWVELMRNSLA